MGINTNPLNTKWGVARIIDGYYRIVSRSKGHHGKLLHRLIFEDFYNIKLPSDIDIHHNDGNKLNNNIWNLIPLTRSEHMAFHQTGENHHLYGKSLSDETKLKISESQSTTGYFRVHIHYEDTCKQGFYYEYRYYKDGKSHSLSSVDINKLKKRVIERGLEWRELNSNNGVVT